MVRHPTFKLSDSSGKSFVFGNGASQFYEGPRDENAQLLSRGVNQHTSGHNGAVFGKSIR